MKDRRVSHWELRGLILKRRVAEAWGARVIDRRLADMRREFPQAQLPAAHATICTALPYVVIARGGAPWQSLSRIGSESCAELREIKLKALVFGADVKVIEPEELREEISKEITKMMKIYPKV